MAVVRHKSALALACAALTMSVVPAGAERVAPPSAGPPLTNGGVLKPVRDPLRYLARPGDDLRLSDEKRITRWTTAYRRLALRSSPRDSARRVGTLSLISASNSREIYGVLRGVVDGQRHVWYQVRVPGRPNGRVAWARSRAFSPLHLVKTRLVVDRTTLRAAFYRNGREVWHAPVGVGKPSTPTPGGHFYVDRKEGAIFGPAYGTNILFTNAYTILEDWPGGGIVGMHGTDAPSYVPGRPSHGCIRLHNADIARLAGMLPVGTPLRIR